MPKPSASLNTRTTSNGKPSPGKATTTHAVLLVCHVNGTTLLCVQAVYNGVMMHTRDWGPTLGKPRRKRDSPDGSSQWYPSDNQVTLIKHFKLVALDTPLHPNHNCCH